MNNYDAINKEILDKTNYWGRKGAGAILFSPEKGKFGLGLRSLIVEQPGKIGTFGGAVDGDRSVSETVQEELSEEIGMLVEPILKKLNVYKDGDFEYHNFLAIIDDSMFFPELNSENDEILWLSLEDITSLKNKHFGLDAILNDKEALSVLQRFDSYKKEIGIEVSDEYSPGG